MSGGSFIGALCAGFIADKWGRRYALMGASIIWIIGAAVQCSSQNVGHLIAGRIVSGLSIGITSSQVCVYLAELAPSRIRGRIVGIQQWAIEWGILIMFLVAWGCTTVAGPSAFRIAWGVQAVPGLILFVALLFFPESPRWLAGQERWEECLQVLAAINAKGDQNDPLVQAEYMEVQEAVRIMQQSRGVGMIELFGPKIWLRTMCGCSVQMWQQLVGGNGKHTKNSLEHQQRHLANSYFFCSDDVLRCLRVQHGWPHRKHHSLLVCHPVCHLLGDNRHHLALHRSRRPSYASSDRCRLLPDTAFHYRWCDGNAGSWCRLS